jgi:DNA repair protein RecO (recombination protein O)
VLVRNTTLRALDRLVQPLDPYTQSKAQPEKAEPESVFPLGSLLPCVDETSYPELRNLITRYMQALLGRTLRMQPYLPTTIR